MASAAHMMSAERLLEAGDIGRCELVRGNLIMRPPAGGEHGRIAARLTARLLEYVEEHWLGVVYGAETGFVIARDADTVRAPDVAFLSAVRAPCPG
jgi:Uma2 family endonuclease